MTRKQQEKTEAITELKQYIKPSSKINIVITNVARSGMSRRMRVYNKDMSRELTYLVGKACELSSNDAGVLVSGCGMDMTFWLANDITYALGYNKRKTLRGNGGSCIDWKAIY